MKPRVLVVDDEKWVRLALSRLLESDGYTVERAVSGEEATERLKQSMYDMVVVDLKLKDLDGIEVLKVAKAQGYDPEVLLITAHGTVETAVARFRQCRVGITTKR